MKKIRILKIIFDFPLKRIEVSKFRGAIASLTRDNVLFHNHTPDGYRYEYPLIQYKVIGGKAALVCINQGVDEIPVLFKEVTGEIKIGKHSSKLKIERLAVHSFNMNVWNKNFEYKIYNWLALNEDNYKKYLSISDFDDKKRFLEKILTGDILSLASGIGWNVGRKINVEISDIFKEKPELYKYINGKPLLLTSISARFRTNVFLPNHLGLGKGASRGFGVVMEIRKDVKNSGN